MLTANADRNQLADGLKQVGQLNPDTVKRSQLRPTLAGTLHVRCS
jgi:hypothetical protein